MYFRYNFDNRVYLIGLYIRLSREDGDDLESESITNQRAILMDFLKHHDLEPVDIYIDDGFSGGNFDRPAFKRLLEDMESGKINCVITKDLSRLGRDFIETGRYVEKYFPEHDIRYIALNDDIDTFFETSGSDMMPFKLSMNDMYAKDISKKVKSVLMSMKKDGKFCGSHPSFGYMNDPQDKHHLVPNPETAPIVKNIFELYVNGYGITAIADILTKEGYPTPIMYKLKKEKLAKRPHPEIWVDSTINNILRNRVYTGCVIQHTSGSINYKCKKRKKIPKNEWYVCENMHEPLVDKETFNMVQVMRNKSNNYDPNRRNVEYTLSNLVFCKDCGSRMSISYDKKRDRISMNCSNYRKFSKYDVCFSHYINYKKLENTVYDKIKLQTLKYKNEVEELSTTLKEEYSDPKLELERKIQASNKEISILQNKEDALYDDKFNGVINNETYQRLFTNTENKINELKVKVNEMKKEKEKISNDQSLYLENKVLIEDFLNMKEPTKEMLHRIVDKIYITKDKQVEIHYNICNQTVAI